MKYEILDEIETKWNFLFLLLFYLAERGIFCRDYGENIKVIYNLFIYNIPEELTISAISVLETKNRERMEYAPSFSEFPIF